MDSQLTEDPTFPTFMQSKEYNAMDRAQRKEFLSTLQGMTPDERLTLSKEVTPGRPSILTRIGGGGGMNFHGGPGTAEGLIKGGKTVATMGIDIAGGVGGALAGGALNPALAIPGEMLGAVGADRLNRAIGLRDPDKVDIPFAGQVENKRLLGPITAGDVAAAAPTGIMRGLAGGAKLLTKPAQQAIKAADEANLTNATAYEGKVQGAIGDSQEAMGAVKARTAKENVKNAKAYQKAVDKETSRFRDQVASINQNTRLSNQEQAQQYADAQRDYTNAVRAHRFAAVDVPAQGTAGIDPGNYREAYAASDEAVQRAGMVDLTPLRAEARRLNIDLTAPLDPLGRTPMSRVTAALSQAGQEAEAPLDRLIATHRALGKVVGSTEVRGGAEWGAARRLYARAEDMLQQARGSNPDAAEAIDQYIEGRRAFRRTESTNDFNELFHAGNNGNKLSRTGDIELNASGIQTKFDQLVRNDRFFAGSFTEDELGQMREALNNLPRRIPREPPANAPGELTPDYAGIKPAQRIPRPETLEPDYSKVASKWPGPRPETEKPDVGSFPFGKFILSKILGQETAARVTGQQGSLPGVGLMVALGGFGVPHWVSTTLLKSTKGTAMVQNILDKKQTLTPAILAGMTSAARAMGGSPEDDTK